jgi:hypothetical protein
MRAKSQAAGARGDYPGIKSGVHRRRVGLCIPRKRL